MKAVMLATLLVLGIAAPAFADRNSEAFVEKHANNVLRVLNDKALTGDARSEQFSSYLRQFASFPEIARRVLGVRGAQVSKADFDRYYVAFEGYAAAVYEKRLDEFRGESVKVVGSADPAPRRSQVSTLIRSGSSGRDISVVWDVLQSKDGQTYRVRDVGLSTGGAVVWLAQDQQAQFETFLDRNNGDINKLIDQIHQRTADIRGRARGSVR